MKCGANKQNVQENLSLLKMPHFLPLAQDVNREETSDFQKHDFGQQ